ncbi:MAG: efflux RND transporter periplasmic adaptor subunit [Magnetococcales bacterium]|nr:efflux RND transporter periplasmic adaptor subunit [Magnetococcales bacterium]
MTRGGKRLLLAAALAAAGGWAAMRSGATPENKTPAGPSPVSAVVAQAQRRALSVEVRTVGRVQPIASVGVRTRLEGEITEVHFREGEEVGEGQRLFTLDERGPQAALAQAEAQQAKERASLVNARQEVDRYTPLAQSGTATRQKLEDAIAKARMAEAGVKAAEAAVASARLMLSYAHIDAPLAGRTGALALHRGDMARVGDPNPLVVINPLRPIHVAFSLPQRELPAIQAGQAQAPLPVFAAFSGDANTPPLEGKLTFIDHAVDGATGAIALKAEFANEGLALWPGRQVNVTLRLREEPDVVVVPAPAVQNSQQGTYVFLVTPEEKAEMRSVKVARTQGGMAVIGEGLSGGESVVVDGQFRMSPGSPVIVRKTLDGAAGGETKDGKAALGKAEGSQAPEAASFTPSAADAPSGGGR